MLFRRITTCFFTEATYVCDLLWKIYYNETERCIYAIPKEDKKLLDIYLLNGLRHNVDLGMGAEMYLLSSTKFIPYREERNAYMNEDTGKCIQLTSNNEVYEELEDENGNIYLGEEWILLANKLYIDKNASNKTTTPQNKDDNLDENIN